MAAMIDVERLSREFTVRQKAGRFRSRRRTVHAVRDLTFTIGRGEVVGYLGPNGAGKSTSIKMMTGVLVPSGGRVTVAGLDPVRQRRDLASRMGVMFGQRTQLWWDLPLVESFDILRQVYGIPAGRYHENLDRFRSLLDLDPFIGTPVRQLSLGQRLRGELVASLLHDPEVVFLDEPTIGLDVVAKQRVRDFLTAINRERDVTVILATHDLSDIERLCTRLLMIDQGLIVYDGSVDQLIRRYGEMRTLVVDLEEPQPPLAVPRAKVERVDGPRQWLRFSRHELSAAELVSAVEAQAAVVDLTLEEPDVEEIVRRIYEDRPADNSSSPDTVPPP